MKFHKIISGALLTACAFSMGTLTSCDDFLEVLPTTQITEQDFFEDKGDLDNLRAGAYKQLLSLTGSIFYWGELRSDNIKLKDQSNTTYLEVHDQAILRPSNGSFSWSGFYTGINYCNKVLEKGEEMTNEPLVDPSFSKSDFTAYSAEMRALRALYYFYLVRAFRDVPFVTTTVSTDAEAKRSYYPVTSGEAILDELISEVDSLKDYASVNYGSVSENKGRFTPLSIRALLADMYLWRGCMLKNYSKKTDAAGHPRAIHLSDELVLGTDGDTIGYTTADGAELTDAIANAEATRCFQKANEYATEVLKKINYDVRLTKTTQELERLDDLYPLYRLDKNRTTGRAADEIYARIWGSKNSDESIMEIQFDGTINKCDTYSLLFTSTGNSYNAGTFVANDDIISGRRSDRPDQGFGRKDLRMLQTVCYTKEFSQTSTYPIHKNVLRSLTVEQLEDLTEEEQLFQAQYRETSSLNANWPIYRVSDMMLIKAEAIARMTSPSSASLGEGTALVNHLFGRNNPAVTDSLATATADVLLTRVYYERQREFVGEGKRWFDIARQAEGGDYYTNSVTTLMEDMASFIPGVKKQVVSRMRNLWSFYCPITESEMEVEGVKAGGYIYQNPVWDRYSKK